MDAHFTDLFTYYEALVAGHDSPKSSAAARRPPLVGAVELGGTKVVVAVGRGPNNLVARNEIATTDPATTLAAVTAFLREHGAGLEAIGVAAFGPVALDRARSDWGSITFTTKPGWSNTAIAAPLTAALGVPVAFDSDVNGAALGEYRHGALRGVASGLYLTVGTGIGGGYLVDGKPLHGLVNPEMGHGRIKRRPGDTFAGTCPFHGDCLEGLASGPAILSRLGSTLSDVAPGDAGRAGVLDDLGQGIASLVLTLSPARVVIGGGVAKTPGFHAQVAARMRHWLGGYVHATEVTRDDYLVAPALGDDAGVVGALALAHDLLDRVRVSGPNAG